MKNKPADNPAEILRRFEAAIPKLIRGITPEHLEAAFALLPLEDRVRFMAALLGHPVPPRPTSTIAKTIIRQ